MNVNYYLWFLLINGVPSQIQNIMPPVRSYQEFSMK